MPKPETVSPKSFLLGSILYDDGQFSIAFGTWNSDQPDEAARLAMRWNGTDDGKDVGYPKLFGNPVWFQIPEVLIPVIAVALRGVEGSREEGIDYALNYIGHRG